VDDADGLDLLLAIAAQALLDDVGIDPASPVRRLGKKGVAAAPCRNSVHQAEPARHLLPQRGEVAVSYMRTRSPGLRVLTRAASHAPVPEAG
jgi:hypothetical protein